MANRRIFYTGLVIILTVITLGAIISMRIDEYNPDVYDKLDTNIKHSYRSKKWERYHFVMLRENIKKVGESPTF